jgi:hypothetical protein
MQPALTPPATSERLVAYYRSGDTLRSRSVGARVLSGQVEIPAPSPRLLADWRRDVAEQLALEPGDVEPLNLHRARLRWPDYRQCVQALTAWTRRHRPAGGSGLCRSGPDGLPRRALPPRRRALWRGGLLQSLRQRGPGAGPALSGHRPAPATGARHGGGIRYRPAACGGGSPPGRLQRRRLCARARSHAGVPDLGAADRTGHLSAGPGHPF